MQVLSDGNCYKSISKSWNRFRWIRQGQSCTHCCWCPFLPPFEILYCQWMPSRLSKVADVDSRQCQSQQESNLAVDAQSWPRLLEFDEPLLRLLEFDEFPTPGQPE